MANLYPARNSYRGSVAARYDQERFTSVKGRWLDSQEKKSITRALQHVPADCTILDVPCGTGRITEHLLNLGYRVAAGDISPDMIALGQQRIGSHERLIGVHELNAENMWLPTDSYDCITSVRFMGHLPSPVKLNVLREMARVARQYLVVTFYKAGPLRSLKWLLAHRTSMSRSAWYPVTGRELDRLLKACDLTPLAHYRVFPLLSDGMTYVLRVPRS